MDDTRTFLRHTLATLAYRAAKALRNATPSFGSFQSCETERTPVEVLAHMGDLMDWALSLAEGNQQWHNSKPLPWTEEAERFFASLKKLDDYLASGNTVHVPCEQLFQGPVADALTHTGQLAMLRHLSGAKMKGENYYIADISVGCVGVDQPAPKLEF